MNRLRDFVLGVIQTFARIGQDVLEIRNSKVTNYQVKVPKLNILKNGDFSKSTLEANRWRVTNFMTDNVAIIDGYGRFRVSGASSSGRLERVILLDKGTYSISFVTKSNPVTGDRLNFTIRSFVNGTILTPIEEQYEDINDTERLHYATFIVPTTGNVTIRAYYGNEPVGTQILVKFINIVQGDVNLRDFTKSQEEVNEEVDYEYLTDNFYNKNQIDGFDFADKQYVMNMFDNVTSIRFEVVGQLPATGESNVIYLVPNGGTAPNIKDEYIWVDNQWEIIGTTEIDLADYVKEVEMEDYVNGEINNTIQYVNTSFIPQTHPSYNITSQNIQDWVETSNLVEQGGIPRTSLLINNTIDLNELTEPGFYHHSGGSAPLNTPTAGAGSVAVTYAGGTAFLKQIWQERDGQREFSRTMSSNSSWTIWIETWKSNNLRSNSQNDARYYTKTQIDGFNFLTQLPTASSTTLGGIKVGANLSVTPDGTLSATNTTYSNMSLSELNTGTSTTARSISAKNLNDWLSGKNYVTSSIINGLASESWVSVNYIPQTHPSYGITTGDIVTWDGYEQRILDIEQIETTEVTDFDFGSVGQSKKYVTPEVINKRLRNKVSVGVAKDVNIPSGVPVPIKIDFQEKFLETGVEEYTELFIEGGVIEDNDRFIIKEEGVYQIYLTNIDTTEDIKVSSEIILVTGAIKIFENVVQQEQGSVMGGIIIAKQDTEVKIEVTNIGTNNGILGRMEVNIVKIN